MSLEEMQEKWSEMDAKLDRSLRLNKQLLTESKLKSAGSVLGRLRVGLWIEWMVWIVLAGSLALFTYHHMNSLALALSGVAVFLYADLNGIAVAVQIAKLKQLNCSQSVAHMQVQLQRLRMFRVRYISGAILLGVVLWAPAAFVWAKAFFNIDVYPVFGALWLWSNVAFGFAAAALILWATRRFGSRLSSSSCMRHLADDIAGASLKKAAHALAAVREFES